jgi:hypothetical protein
MKDLREYSIQAADGALGLVKDFYFDDEAWVIRYLVVEVDPGERAVLLSPISIGHPNWEGANFPTTLTRQQVNDSPGVDTHRPVSRQHEERQLRYYGYGTYWGGAGQWGAGMCPSTLQSRVEQSGAVDADRTDRPDGDSHLRSANEIRTYHVHANDGDVGPVNGFLVDESTWAIPFLIVNSSKWWIGHEVLVAPQWIERVDWRSRTVFVNLTRNTLRDAPPYDAKTQLQKRLEEAGHS